MIASLRRFFEQNIVPAAEATDDDHGLHLATTAMLLEVGRADFDISTTERDHILAVVQQHFSLSSTETDELVRLAESEVDAAVSLHQFTALINEHMSAGQKVRIVEMMWAVAYADTQIDKYEEYLIRKVAELLYVPHQAFIRAKHKAAEQVE